MLYDHTRLQYLFHQYASGKANAVELDEFWQLLGKRGAIDDLPESMQDWWGKNEAGTNFSEHANGQQILSKILGAMPARIIRRGRLHSIKTWAAAAVLLISIGISVYFFLAPGRHSSFPVAKVSNPAFKNDVLPGVTGATLTLSDGSMVALDSSGNQVLLAKQGQVEVITGGGRLIYNGSDNINAYNTLTTAHGQKFPVRLSDGTLVILDAGSSLTYPVSFNGKERKVNINGQAWFEVAHIAGQPFIVQKGDKRVQVLGTHFNVNAYDDEMNLKVTLVEGSVKVNNGTTSNQLRPGQQAVLNKSGNGIQVIKDANIARATAWKNGQFEFNSSDITEVLREVARWYDIEVEYAGARPKDTFTGGINRSASLTELLTILEMSNMRFTLQGRKLTVLPQ